MGPLNYVSPASLLKSRNSGHGCDRVNAVDTANAPHDAGLRVAANVVCRIHLPWLAVVLNVRPDLLNSRKFRRCEDAASCLHYRLG